MLRMLGQSQYGVYNLVSSVVSYMSLLSFGFYSAYMRYQSRYKVHNKTEHIAALNAMFLIIYLCISFLAIVIGSVLVLNIEFVLGSKLDKIEIITAKKVMIIMVINMSLSYPFSVFNSYITLNEKYVFQKFMQLVIAIANPFVMLPVLLMGFKAVGMSVVFTILTLVVEVSNIIYCMTKLKMRFHLYQFDFKLLKEMIAFSSYVFLNMVVELINWSVDKVILGRVSGSIAVAVYGLAIQLNSYYYSFSSAISSVFIPKVNEMVALANNNKDLTGLLTRIGRIQFFLLSFICTGLIFFGRPFINLWAGEEYSDVYEITLLIVIPVTIPLIQSLGIEIQRAKNMHQFYSWIYLFIALGKVSISIPLARMYGGVGAAVGTTISLLIGNGIIMNWNYSKRIGLDMKYFWCQIVKIIPSFIPSIILGSILYWFVDLYQIQSFFLYGLLYSLVFLVSVWLFGMNQYEKNQIIRAKGYLNDKILKIRAK